MELRDKKITVVGLMRSGIAAANLLAEFGAEVTITDKKTLEELSESVKQLSPVIKLSLGGHPGHIFESADLIVISPGVPMDIAPLKLAEDRGVRIIGELELSYQIICSLTASHGKSNTEFLAITGTNGKSTTTALLGLMVRNAGFRAVVGGNIGNALTGEVMHAINEKSAGAPDLSTSLSPFDADYIVAEVSSYQLESIQDFRPKVSAILNVTPDHLDRYHTLEKYGDAKARIFENQTKNDYLVINADDPETMRIYGAKQEAQNLNSPHVVFFSREREVEGLYLKDGLIRCNLPELNMAGSHFNLDPSSFRIKGVHNLENAMAASAMALLAGCNFRAVEKTLSEFPGLEHRLEFVREHNGVRYFNDSKGTNVGAVIKSLDSFSDPVILIAGGRDKAGDFFQLRELVRERVKTLVLIGEAREKIRKALGDLTETIFAENLRDAVYAARNSGETGDVVLLSPACASFDMFTDFEDRGRQFKEIVRGMA
jgi:UDP-N-acetylmuramoylalanine--D-glutamate ligase